MCYLPTLPPAATQVRGLQKRREASERAREMASAAPSATTSPLTLASEKSTLTTAAEADARRETAAWRVLRQEGRLLLLAVKWDSLEASHQMLSLMGSAGAFYQDEKVIGASEVAAYQDTIGHALQLALELQRSALVRELLEVTSVDEINMCELYCYLEAVHGETFDMERVYLKSRLRQHGFDPDTHNTLARSNQHMAGILKRPRPDHKRVFMRYVQSLTPGINDMFLVVGDDDHRPTTYLDLFLWAVILGIDALILPLWGRCEQPVHVAILGASVARKVATSIYGAGQGEMIERADYLEGLAAGCLNACNDQRTAMRLLEEGPHGSEVKRSEESLLDLAFRCKVRACMRNARA